MSANKHLLDLGTFPLRVLTAAFSSTESMHIVRRTIPGEGWAGRVQYEIILTDEQVRQLVEFRGHALEHADSSA